MQASSLRRHATNSQQFCMFQPTGACPFPALRARGSLGVGSVRWRGELPRGISRYKPTSRGKPRGIRPDKTEAKRLSTCLDRKPSRRRAGQTLPLFEHPLPHSLALRVLIASAPLFAPRYSLLFHARSLEATIGHGHTWHMVCVLI
jgi:hypothetical protein